MPTLHLGHPDRKVSKASPATQIVQLEAGQEIPVNSHDTASGKTVEGSCCSLLLEIRQASLGTNIVLQIVRKAGMGIHLVMVMLREVGLERCIVLQKVRKSCQGGYCMGRHIVLQLV